MDGQALEARFIAVIDGFFLGDVLIKVGVLAPDDTGDDVGHAVVIAHLLVLVPGGVFPGLGGPLAGLIGHFQVIGQQAAAGGAGDDLIAVIRDG